MNLCKVCNQSAERSYIISLKDKHNKIEIAGCKSCIEALTDKIRSYEDRSKYTIEKMLGLVGLDEKDFEFTKLGK